MKRFFGLCIIVIMLVAASGCTQQATQPAATPVPAAEVTQEVTMPPATQEPVTVSTTSEVTQVPVETQTVAAPAETPKPELTHSKTTVIYIRNNTFVPDEMMVLPGTGITWVNEDSTVHIIKTLPDIGIKFTSSDIVKGASYGYTFSEKEGTYRYYDPYTNATGVIIVKKGASVLGAPTLQTTVPVTNQ